MRWPFTRRTSSAPQPPAEEPPDPLREKYFAAELDVHGPVPELPGYWETFRHVAFYEDGLFTVHSRPFEHDHAFMDAYSRVVHEVMGGDPHTTWRAYVYARLLLTRLPGTVVELGAGRGVMNRVAFEYARNLGRIDELLSPPAAQVIVVDKYDNRSVDPLSGESTGWYPDEWNMNAEFIRGEYARYPCVEVVEGFVPDVLPTIALAGPIAFLHVDLNAARPTAEGLEWAWPRMAPGGIMVFDDYGHHDHVPTMTAADAFAASVGMPLIGIPTMQALGFVPPTHRPQGDPPPADG